PEAYAWLLVPEQEVQGPVEWQEIRLQGDDLLAIRAARRLKNDGLLAAEYAPTNLRRDLDRIPLWRGDHVGVKQLRDDFATYLYLPRLKDADVLLAAIRDGVGSLTWESEAFAYADAFDIATSRYLGLRAGETGSVVLNNDSVVVKPEAARRQLDADDAARREREGGRLSVREGAVDYVEHPGGVTSVGPSPHPGDGHRPVGPRPTVLRRFHGAATLDPLRVSTQSQQIAEAVVQHLAGLVGARVRITLEIEADLPDGAPDHVVRTVTENCRALRFTDAGFEES
ncbi:MAG: AAA+ family ATPase, partial [Chloroflexota bacterium]|nr:AAA+ family ATPase [Chloroflexota bacterium]